MSEVKILLSGAAGRMGLEISSVIRETKGLELAAEVDRKGKLSSFGKVEVTPDVVIDFSSPELFREALAWAVSNSVPFVCGTTGLEAGDQSALDEAAKKIPVLWSANMSMGINLLLGLLPKLKAFEDYDFQIEEFHHNKKVDRPSGTAKVLQNSLEKSVGKSLPEPMVGRGGGIFGIHKIWMMAEEETLVFEHTALNRRIFARGATKAAVWLKGKSAGRYQVADMLGLGD